MAEKLDTQLADLVGFDPVGKTTEEKMKALRTYREEQYDAVVSATYIKRGWDTNGVPTLDRLKELGIDLPELVAIVEGSQ